MNTNLNMQTLPIMDITRPSTHDYYAGKMIGKN